MSYFDVDDATFNQQLRMFETTDPVHADTFNDVAEQLIKNDVALHKAVSGFASDKNTQALFLLNLHKTGKKYGVHFDAFGINSACAGTRLGDAIGMTAAPSTNSIKARNDFEDEGPFYHLEVNGSVGTNGEFTVTAIKGIDSTFTRTGADVWCLYLPHYFKFAIGANGEDMYISDTQYAGYIPQGAALKTDGTVRPFVAMAKYVGSTGADGKVASISGKLIKTGSHNSNITDYHAKGTQYCAITAQDQAHYQNLFEVAFATKNFQSVMAGCTSYYLSYVATLTETGVESIVIAKSQANNLLPGSVVSIATTDHGTDIVSRAVITAIEDYDSSNSRVYIDNGGTTFNVTNGTTRISTFPWKTGACDDVLGSCGSPTSNTSGKEPCLLFGCEMFVGAWEILGNVIFKENGDGTGTMHICYDCTKLATSITSDYVAVDYDVANTVAAWGYISELGFDTSNPSVRFPSGVGASSSTGYADGLYTRDLAVNSDAREVLVRGGLAGGAPCGLFAAGLLIALSISISMFMARFGMDVLDFGTPLLNMHAPWELAAKTDCFWTQRASSCVMGVN